MKAQSQPDAGARMMKRIMEQNVKQARNWSQYIYCKNTGGQPVMRPPDGPVDCYYPSKTAPPPH